LHERECLSQLNDVIAFHKFPLGGDFYLSRSIYIGIGFSYMCAGFWVDPLVDLFDFDDGVDYLDFYLFYLKLLRQANS
jgi:hypothetical protein